MEGQHWLIQSRNSDEGRIMESNFYHEWLNSAKRAAAERAEAKIHSRGRDLNWIITPQDSRMAMLAGPEGGFKTMGGCVLIGEIPAGWKTGCHRHGEESIYILEGEGHSLIGTKKYSWEAGDCLQIYSEVSHQHFNTGSRPVLYLQAMLAPLEAFIGVLNYVQESEAGILSDQEKREHASLPEGDSGMEYSGKILMDEAAASGGPVEDPYERTKRIREAGRAYLAGRVILRKRDTQWKPTKQAGMRCALITHERGFTYRAVNMSLINEVPPRWHTGRHIHAEAMIYVLEGKGYSIIDGKRYEWEAGDLLHVQGPHTDHQHFNTQDTPVRYMRIGFTIRDLYPNYDKKEQVSYSGKIT